MTWNPVGAGAADSGDLGFTYGLLGTRGKTDSATGHYVENLEEVSGI